MFPTVTYKKMDMQSRLQRKKQDSAMKIRNINKTAKRILRRRLEDMEATFRREDRIRFKECKKLEYELVESDRANDKILHLPPVSSSPDGIENEFDEDFSTPRSARGSPFHKPGTRCSTCSPCRFLIKSKKSKCRYFPCSVPTTYHSIGYNIQPPSKVILEDYGFEVYTNYSGVPVKEGPAKDKHKDDDDDDLPKSPRCSIKERLRGLKQLVKEMKDRNERSKPQDWAVNYGQPVSRRQLLNPVIPVYNMHNTV